MTQQNNPLNEKEQSELQLLPRLRWMGFLLLFFSVCSLFYSFFFATDIPSNIAQDLATDQFLSPAELQQVSGLPMTNTPSFEIFQVERFNAYIVTFCFALVGGICLLATWKKEKRLQR
ncbi:MAG: hypothetical protein HYZ48_00935 [Chlamydiales bacterium]|nr:hypothetical protein [Chlamydiales bacterium]